MADVYVNALTTISTEPGTTDSVVCVNRNTNEGQIIDYNLLADKILDKLTSKQYSALTTTSKLITGAINELDSDVASLNSSLGLASGQGTLSSSVSGVLYYSVVCGFVLIGGTVTVGSNGASGVICSALPAGRVNNVQFYARDNNTATMVLLTIASNGTIVTPSTLAAGTALRIAAMYKAE